MRHLLDSEEDVAGLDDDGHCADGVETELAGGLLGDRCGDDVAAGENALMARYRRSPGPFGGGGRI